MKRRLTFVIAMLAALVVCAPAAAHLISRPAGKLSLVKLERHQARQLHHAETATVWLVRHRASLSPESYARELAFHRAWQRIMRREVAETRERLHLAAGARWPWNVLGDCETTGDGDGRIDWAYGPYRPRYSGFDGGLQFHPGTWSAYRLPGYPAVAYRATAAQQMRVADRVLAAEGFGAWPACSRRHRLR